MQVHKKVEVKKTKKGDSLFSKCNINQGEIILEFEKNFQDTPSRYTLQIDETRYQVSNDKDAYENFINHSCDANGYIDFNDLTFRAARDIKAGEELTFNYNTTEWDMENGEDEAFTCRCGVSGCLKRIRGFRYLTAEQKKSFESLLSPHLSHKYNQDNMISEKGHFLKKRSKA